MAHNSEDTARSRPRSMKWVRAPPQPVRSRDKSSDHCGQCPPVSHGGDGGQASVWLLLSQDNADIPKRRIWCRETTLRNTHLGPVLSAGQGSQVRTGKSEGGKGFRRRGPDSSCSHPTPTRLRPSPPAPPAPVTLLGIARVQAARHRESSLQQAGRSGQEPSPPRPPHLPRQIRPSRQSVSCCG